MKDLFAGAVGGVAQVLLGMHIPVLRRVCMRDRMSAEGRGLGQSSVKVCHGLLEPKSGVL
jgi:hypothetical protein